MNGFGKRAFWDRHRLRRLTTKEQLQLQVPKPSEIPPPLPEKEIGDGPESQQDVDSRLVLSVGEHALDRRHHGEGARADCQHHEELGRVSLVGETSKGPPPQRLLPDPPLPDVLARPTVSVELDEDVKTGRGGRTLAFIKMPRRQHDRELPRERFRFSFQFEHQVLAGPGLEYPPAGEVELEGPARWRLVPDFPKNAPDVVFRAHFPGRNAVCAYSPLDQLASAPPRLHLLLVKVENARTAALAATIGGLRTGREGIQWLFVRTSHEIPIMNLIYVDRFHRTMQKQQKCQKNGLPR